VLWTNAVLCHPYRDMKIAILGATGFVATPIVQEAVGRGHHVTALSRTPSKVPQHPLITAVPADVFDVPSLVAAFRGQDAIIHSYAPAREGTIEERCAAQRTATENIVTAMKEAGVPRILAVGGAGTLEVEPGVRFMDHASFPPAWQGGAQSTAQVKEVLKHSTGINWTYLSPPYYLQPGERTRHFRLGLDELLRDEKGESRITVGDYAIAMIDELETPRHTGRRFTVAY